MSVDYIHNGSFQPAELIELFNAVCFNRLNEWNLENTEEIISNTDHYILATEAGKLIGFVRLLTDWHTCGYINNLCVAPSYQNRGIGKSLMRELLTLCDDQNILILNLYDTSNKPDFYKSLGFESNQHFTGMIRRSPRCGI